MCTYVPKYILKAENEMANGLLGSNTCKTFMTIHIAGY